MPERIVLYVGLGPDSGLDFSSLITSAYSQNLTLALPKAVGYWSLTTLREKLIKIGAKVVSHGRYITFQLAEVVISRALFADILQLIDGLRPRPAPT